MNRRQKIFLGIVAISLSLLLIAGAFISSFYNSNNSKKLQVLATFYPLYFFASEIGKEKAKVNMLVPNDAEIHSWQPGISDILNIENANIFIYNGAGLEPWVEDILDAIKNKPLIVDTSKNIPLQFSSTLQEVLDTATTLLSQNCTEINSTGASLQPTNTTAYQLALNNSNKSVLIQLNLSQISKILIGFNETLNFTLGNATQIAPEFTINKSNLDAYPPLHLVYLYHLDPGTYDMVFNLSANNVRFVILEMEKEGEDEHEHGIYDPHIWLDPLLAKIQVRNILDGFSVADPENAEFYKANAEAILKKLDKLHSDFTTGLKNKTKSAIICSHLAFNYLGKRYSFSVHAALGITADKEPSPGELAQLVEKINTLQLHYVFVEPGYPDRYMYTIANQTGAGILVLDALHKRVGDHANLDYFQIMYKNLQNLRVGLEVRD